jgi:hypothetical protein
MNMAGMDCKFSEPKPGLILKSPAHLFLSLALFRSYPAAARFHRAIDLSISICGLRLL